MPEVMLKRFSKSIESKFKVMKLFLKFVDRLSNLGAYLSSFLYLALVSLILTEIFLRAIFNKSTMIADEYSGYFYLASVFFGLGYTFKENAHIRINIITSKLSKKANRFTDIFAGSVTLGVVIFILYRITLLTMDSYSFEILSEGVSETPIYLTQIPMIVGIFIFALAVFGFVLKRMGDDS